MRWRKLKAGTRTPQATDGDDDEYVTVPTVLIIDQFEEIITNNPDRWPDRRDFFIQLDAAMQADPQLWVVLTMREDFVAALDPYAGLLEDRLRARFYMERMGEDAALQAVQRPAEVAGKPFTPDAAQRLVDDLRLVRTQGAGDVQTLGQYVEPVQLQVVCYQLWESLAEDDDDRIDLADLERLAGGDNLAEFVDRALGDFYARTLTEVLAAPESPVSEQEARTWVERQLITEAGTRGLVYQGDETTAGLPNPVVLALAARFLLRGETRAGGTWYELVHDRFVDPILANNAAWFPAHQSALQRQAALWRDQGRPAGLLLQDDALDEAEAWAAAHENELERHEKDFLAACREARAVAERAERQNRRIRQLLFVAVIVSMMALAAAGYAGYQTLRAESAVLMPWKQKSRPRPMLPKPRPSVCGPKRRPTLLRPRPSVQRHRRSWPRRRPSVLRPRHGAPTNKGAWPKNRAASAGVRSRANWPIMPFSNWKRSARFAACPDSGSRCHRVDVAKPARQSRRLCGRCRVRSGARNHQCFACHTICACHV